MYKSDPLGTFVKQWLVQPICAISTTYTPPSSSNCSNPPLWSTITVGITGVQDDLSDSSPSVFGAYCPSDKAVSGAGAMVTADVRYQNIISMNFPNTCCVNQNPDNDVPTQPTNLDVLMSDGYNFRLHLTVVLVHLILHFISVLSIMLEKIFLQILDFLSLMILEYETY